MENEKTLALNLIREHYEGTKKSFDKAALDLANYYDTIERSGLAEYILAYIYPSFSFTDFETYITIGQIIYKISKRGHKSKYEILLVTDKGCWIKSCRKNATTAKFIEYSELHMDYRLDS